MERASSVSNASSMSNEDLHAFLERLELGHHLDRLVGEEVCSVNRLRTLSEAHLEKIGLKIGARTAILHELEKSKPSPVVVPVEQIAAVQPEIVPSSIPMETPPAPCADEDEQDMALVLPFESSIVLPTAPLVVQEFYRSFLQEKQNNVFSSAGQVIVTLLLVSTVQIIRLGLASRPWKG